MLETLGYRRAVPRARSIAAALAEYHGFRHYERKAAQYGVVAFELGPVPERAPVALRLHPNQRRVVERAREYMELAHTCHTSTDEQEVDMARGTARASHRILVVDGPPGTGKSFVQHTLVREALASGGKVLYVFLTANHSARARETFGDAVDIDTFHGALGDGTDPYGTTGEVLALYTLVMVDECFLLSEALFNHLARLWIAADRVPCLVLAGDRHQMGSPGGRPCWLSPMFIRVTSTTTLVYDSNYQQRSSDGPFIMMLNRLRLTQPTERLGDFSVKLLVRGRKAWRGAEPTVPVIRQLFRAHPNTTVLAITRRGTQRFNDLAVEALFGRRTSLGEIPGDVESNPDNYDVAGKLKAPAQLRALRLALYEGMKLTITKNVCKDIGFVNGTTGILESFDAVNRGVRLVTNAGQRLVSYTWTDRDLDNKPYHPLRPGYCTTIIKMQGAELEHVTLWLDAKNVPGAAYTALSRVRAGKDYLIGGSVKAAHFTPAWHAWGRVHGARAGGSGPGPSRTERARL